MTLSLRDEFEYRIRTALALGLLRGKHGVQVEDAWVQDQIDKAVAAQTPAPISEIEAAEAAVAAAIKIKNPGVTVTGWVISAEVVTAEHPDQIGYTHATASGQSPALTLGLLDTTQNFFRAAQRGKS